MSTHGEPIAVIGTAAIMPQAPNADVFWNNIQQGVYAITETPPERWDPALYWDCLLYTSRCV